ncbi:MAG: exodeoxyribonuclease VII large subunit [Chlorobi bacterium]|nr:exodeoxyribonuclease VII large subunit [Chlorobiota bacterium]
MSQNPLSLHELNTAVKDTVREEFPGLIWITAEISEIRINRTGHCYLELIEKSSDGDSIVAKARGTIWYFTFRMIKPYFEEATGQTLKAGMNILFKASVEFHELYGFSLNIKDIDPNYTLGDIERKKRETIKRLEEEGVFDMNKELDLALVPQVLAVVSSPTAAGYQDFVNQIENNQGGFVFYHKLFEASVQGDEAPSSIVAALERINEYEGVFDAVILIRGGGSAADLMCFDEYEVAVNVAQFPIPVITGIGHERDISVTDLVAHTHLKTPTAVAEFLINRIAEFYGYLDGLQSAFTDIVSGKLKENRHRLELNVQRLKPVVVNTIEKKNNRLERMVSSVKVAAKGYTNKQKQNINHMQELMKYLALKSINGQKQNLSFYVSKLKIETKGYIKVKSQNLYLYEKELELSDPVNVLKRGYSVTYKDGKTIKSVKEIKEGDELVTKLQDGDIKSIVGKLK